MKSIVQTILIVNENQSTIEDLVEKLIEENYIVIKANTYQDALKTAYREKPQLIILDISLPIGDGIELCSELRASKEIENSLIIFYSHRMEKFTQIAAFQAGADDFLENPTNLDLMKFRIAALLKRTIKQDVSIHDYIKTANFIIDSHRMVVSKGSIPIELVKKEFQLFRLLASEAGKVFSREEIFQKIWDRDIIVGYRTIDVHIRKLREKIGKNYIKTVKGIGYKFEN